MKIFRDQNLHITKPAEISDVFWKENPTIGIHGTPGCFNEQALKRFCKEYLKTEQSYDGKYLVQSSEVIQAASEGQTDLGIFAIANSGGGGVLNAIETMGKYNFSVVSIFTMPVNMCLICNSAVDPSTLTRVTAHPVATEMCRHTLTEDYPQLELNPQTDELDTALSVQMVQNGEISSSDAVLASRLASELYGAQIVQEGVQDDPNNATVFVIIKK